jgi:hypothetical protein
MQRNLRDIKKLHDELETTEALIIPEDNDDKDF